MTADEAHELITRLGAVPPGKISFTLAEAAAALGCTENFLSQGVKRIEKPFPHLFMGSRLLFSDEHLREIQRMCEVRTPQDMRRGKPRARIPLGKDGRPVRAIGVRAERRAG